MIFLFMSENRKAFTFWVTRRAQPLNDRAKIQIQVSLIPKFDCFSARTVEFLLDPWCFRHLKTMVITGRWMDCPKPKNALVFELDFTHWHPVGYWEGGQNLGMAPLAGMSLAGYLNGGCLSVWTLLALGVHLPSFLLCVFFVLFCFWFSGKQGWVCETIDPTHKTEKITF